MTFYTYAGETDTCEECGKTFTHDPEYAYKAYFKKGKTYKLYYFCSWKCLQKYRRRKEENQEKPDHYENKPRKQMVRGAKLNAEKAKEIRRLYAAGNCTQQALAAKYHVSVSTVYCVIFGESMEDGGR